MNRFKYLMLITLLHAPSALIAMNALKNKQDTVAIQDLINNLAAVRAQRMQDIFREPWATGKFGWKKEYDPNGAVPENKTEKYLAAQIKTAIENYNNEKNLSLKIPSDQDITDLAKQKIVNDIVQKAMSPIPDKSTIENAIRNTQSTIKDIEDARTKNHWITKPENRDESRFAQLYYQTAKPAYEKALEEYQKQLVNAEKDSDEAQRKTKELMAKGYPYHIQQLIDKLVLWRIEMMKLAFQDPNNRTAWNIFVQGREYDLNNLFISLNLGAKNEFQRIDEIKKAIEAYNKEHSTAFPFPSEDQLNQLAKPTILNENTDTLFKIEAYKEKNWLIKNSAEDQKSKFARFYYETLKNGFANNILQKIIDNRAKTMEQAYHIISMGGAKTEDAQNKYNEFRKTEETLQQEIAQFKDNPEVPTQLANLAELARESYAQRYKETVLDKIVNPTADSIRALQKEKNTQALKEKEHWNDETPLNAEIQRFASNYLTSRDMAYDKKITELENAAKK